MKEKTNRKGMIAFIIVGVSIAVITAIIFVTSFIVDLLEPVYNTRIRSGYGD